MRALFTDGLNSFSHFIFGILAYYFPWILLLFFAYQIYEDYLEVRSRDWVDYLNKKINAPTKTNVFVDCTEFIIGYIAVVVSSRMVRL